MFLCLDVACIVNSTWGQGYCSSVPKSRGVTDKWCLPRWH